MNRVILHVLFSLAIVAAGVGCSACGSKQGNQPNLTKNGPNNRNGQSPTPTPNQTPSGMTKTNGGDSLALDAETAMIFRVLNDVRLKAKGATEFARIVGGLFRGGDELQVGENATAWVSCGDRTCSLGQGLYTNCCSQTCQNEIQLKPPSGEPVRAFMKKNDLPPDELQTLQLNENKIRNLGADEVTTQFLIANLYSSWKLVEANDELHNLSERLEKPEAAKELKTLYGPMMRKTGDLYVKLDQNTRAEEKYKKAVELAPQTKDAREKADSHVILGQYYEKSGQKDKAVVNLKQGEQLYEKGGDLKKAAATRRAIVNIEKP